MAPYRTHTSTHIPISAATLTAPGGGDGGWCWGGDVGGDRGGLFRKLAVGEGTRISRAAGTHGCAAGGGGASGGGDARGKGYCGVERGSGSVSRSDHVAHDAHWSIGVSQDSVGARGSVVVREGSGVKEGVGVDDGGDRVEEKEKESARETVGVPVLPIRKLSLHGCGGFGGGWRGGGREGGGGQGGGGVEMCEEGGGGVSMAREWEQMLRDDVDRDLLIDALRCLSPPCVGLFLGHACARMRFYPLSPSLFLRCAIILVMICSFPPCGVLSCASLARARALSLSYMFIYT